MEICGIYLLQNYSEFTRAHFALLPLAARPDTAVAGELVEGLQRGQVSVGGRHHDAGSVDDSAVWSGIGVDLVDRVPNTIGGCGEQTAGRSHRSVHVTRTYQALFFLPVLSSNWVPVSRNSDKQMQLCLSPYRSVPTIDKRSILVCHRRRFLTRTPLGLLDFQRSASGCLNTPYTSSSMG